MRFKESCVPDKPTNRWQAEGMPVMGSSLACARVSGRGQHPLLEHAGKLTDLELEER
jgi:hypothetical protein